MATDRFFGMGCGRDMRMALPRNPLLLTISASWSSPDPLPVSCEGGGRSPAGRG